MNDTSQAEDIKITWGEATKLWWWWGWRAALSGLVGGGGAWRCRRVHFGPSECRTRNYSNSKLSYWVGLGDIYGHIFSEKAFRNTTE